MQLNNVTIQSSEENKLYYSNSIKQTNKTNPVLKRKTHLKKNAGNRIERMHCAGLQFRLIQKLISRAGLRIGLKSELPVLLLYY